jgi:hypothetical protein
MFIPDPGSWLWIFFHPGSASRIQRGQKSTGSRIRNTVFMSRFLLGEVGDDERDESLIDDRLNLGLVSGRDVGEEPDCFLQTDRAAILERHF